MNKRQISRAEAFQIIRSGKRDALVGEMVRVNGKIDGKPSYYLARIDGFIEDAKYGGITNNKNDETEVYINITVRLLNRRDGGIQDVAIKKFSLVNVSNNACSDDELLVWPEIKLIYENTWNFFSVSGCGDKVSSVSRDQSTNTNKNSNFIFKRQISRQEACQIIKSEKRDALLGEMVRVMRNNKAGEPFYFLARIDGFIEVAEYSVRNNKNDNATVNLILTIREQNNQGGVKETQALDGFSLLTVSNSPCSRDEASFWPEIKLIDIKTYGIKKYGFISESEFGDEVSSVGSDQANNTNNLK